MASTIQIKTGTGSAVPSNLTQGELAVNIDNGLFYYGSGSGNVTKKLEDFANITASGIIKAEGLLITDDATITDDLKVDGDIDLEGNMDINGSLETDGLTIGGTNISTLLAAKQDVSTLGETISELDFTAPVATVATNVTAVATTDNTSFLIGMLDGASGTQAVETSTKFKFNPSTGATTIDGNITASGNISSSGDLYVTGDIGIGTNSPSEELEIFKTGENAQMAITRGTDTQLKLKAQDNQTRITYEGGPLLFDRDESGTNALTLGVGGDITASGNINTTGILQVEGINAIDYSNSTHLIGANTSFIKLRSNVGIEATSAITASSHISASGHISASAGSNAGFAVRPNLYWFATNTAETVAANSNDGAFPSTDTTKIAWTEEVCSHQDIFVFASDTLTIKRAGLYKFTYNVTIGINNGSNRTEGGIAILRTPDGGSIAVVDGSVTSTYNRFVEGGGLASRGTGAATVVVNVAVDDVFQIDFAKICDTTDATKLKTLPEGTSWYVEALS